MNATGTIFPGGLNRRQWTAEKKAPKDSERNEYASSAKEESPLFYCPAQSFDLQQEEPIGTKQTSRQLAQLIKDTYPDVDFKFMISPERFSAKILAEASGEGIHCIISQDFLASMTNDAEAQSEGDAWIKKILDQLFALPKEVSAPPKNPVDLGAVIHGTGQTTLWATLSEPPKLPEYISNINSYQEKGGRNVTEIHTKDGTIRFVFIKRVNYSAGKDLMRLAQIRSANQVRAFTSGIQSYMNQIRSDRALDQSEIRAALAQMKGVILRASTKVRSLANEDLMSSIQKHAIEQKNMIRADQIAKELARKKTVRKSREYAEAKTADNPLQELYPTERTTSLTYEEERAILSAVSAELPSTGTESAPAGAEGTPSGAETSALPVDVQV